MTEMRLCLVLREGTVQSRTWARRSAVAHAHPDIIAPKAQPARDRNLAQGEHMVQQKVLDLRRAAGSAWVVIIVRPHRQSAIRMNVVMLSFFVHLVHQDRFQYGRGTILKVET